MKKMKKKKKLKKQKSNPISELCYAYIEPHIHMILVMLENADKPKEHKQYLRRKTNDTKRKVSK